MKTLKKVVENWGAIEVFFFVILIPISLVYVLVRFIQEYEEDDFG